MDRLSSSSGSSQARSGQPLVAPDTSSPSRRRPANPPGTPDTPDTVLTFASFQRSQTRREGRPENTGALSGNPRVERQMQQLCNDLERNAGKIKALHDRAAGPARTGDSARLEALRANRRQLTTQLKDCMRVLEPDLHGTIMERVKSQATRDLEQTYLHVWNDYQRTQKAGYTKHLWTILSGGIAYSIPFGTATMLARGTELPFLGLLAGPLHTLAEPLWTMLRATTWTNPASEAYTGRQRARARSNGDAWRYLANVPPKTKMLWIDPVTGKRALLTAAQALATNQELWLWLHKMISDDFPFYTFSVIYSIKNVLGDVYGPALFDRSRPEGKRNDLGAQYSAGFLSGAITALLGQRIRRAMAGSTGGVEVVTKRLHDWQLQALYLNSYAEDIKDMLARGTVPDNDARLLRAKLREVEMEFAKANAKSTLFGSIAYEYSVMFQKKRLASGTDPDMPGKRLDTLCNMLGKTTTLLPSLAATYLCQPYARSPDRMTRMIAHVVVPFTLVTWPGFAMRTEVQDWYRSLFGACKGIASAIRAGCCSSVDDPDDSGSSEEESDLLTNAEETDPDASPADPSGGSIADRSVMSNPDSDSDSVF